jgi:hypothetical protein
MTVPPISPQWLRKGNFVVKALSPSVMWPPTFGETPMSAVVSGQRSACDWVDLGGHNTNRSFTLDAPAFRLT